MLSATFVKNVKRPGSYCDDRGGLGLGLLVSPAIRGLNKCWTQSFRRQVGFMIP